MPFCFPEADVELEHRNGKQDAAEDVTKLAPDEPGKDKTVISSKHPAGETPPAGDGAPSAIPIA